MQKSILNQPRPFYAMNMDPKYQPLIDALEAMQEATAQKKGGERDPVIDAIIKPVWYGMPEAAMSYCDGQLDKLRHLGPEFLELLDKMLFEPSGKESFWHEMHRGEQKRGLR